jgi:TolB protein
MSSNLGLVPSDGGAGSELLVGWFLITAPSWSPDGTKILFSGRREDSDRSVIWVMPAGGGEPTPLTTGQADDASPAWSPDGGRIAFASSRTSTWDLWIMSSEGANLTRLTFDSSGHEYYPSWSPDSRAIVFTMWRLDIPDIWVMSLR